MTKLSSEAEVIRALTERVMLKAPPNSESMAYILKTWNPLRSVADAHELLERFFRCNWIRSNEFVHGSEHGIQVWVSSAVSFGANGDTFCRAAVNASLASIDCEYVP